MKLKAATFLLCVASAPAVHAQLGSTPRFEANQGQTDPEARFLVRGAGYVAFLTPGELVLRLAHARGKSDPAVVRLRFAGSSEGARLLGKNSLATRSHYFIGNDPDRWRTGVPSFEQVECQALYPGIDLVYTGRGPELELQWLLAPGASPRQIRIDFEGVEGLELQDSGDLLIDGSGVKLKLGKPTLYQETEHGRRKIAGRYAIQGSRRVGFVAGEYDPGKALVIDPILTYSSYLGGFHFDFAHAVAVDGTGHLYVAGQSLSTVFPAQGGFGAPPDGRLHAYVAKLDRSGASLEYVTFIGGTNFLDFPSVQFDKMALSVDGAGFAYLTGETAESDFPAVNAVQSQNGGLHDAFVVKIGPAGSPLIFSTYLGGSDEDWGRGLAVDRSGSVLLAGFTRSSDFPTWRPLQGQLNGRSDAFLAKLDPAGSLLVYSTYLGGSDGSNPSAFGDLAYDVAADDSGSGYFTGYTSSPDFPTVNAWQPSFGGGIHDGFVTKIAADGSALLYSSYLGGTGDEEGLGIALDPSGAAYVTGWSTSPDFPTRFPAQPLRAGDLDVFASKLSADGMALEYSTYLGGTGSDYGNDIAVDRRGRAHLTGITRSVDFPLVSAVQPSYGGGDSDTFVTRLSASGSTFLDSTFLGGSATEDEFQTSVGIALTRTGNVVVAGTTASFDFPIVEPLQPASVGLVDGFVAKIGHGPEVRLGLEPQAGGNSLSILLANGDRRSRQVELKVWIGVNAGTFALYPTGFVTTLAPGEKRSVPDISLPGSIPFPGSMVVARMLDAATGEILSESACSLSPCD